MKRPFLGFEIDASDVDSCVDQVMHAVRSPGRRRWLACMNPHSYAVALQDDHFACALRGADWLIPDGVAVVMGSWLLGTGIRHRVSGPDIFFALHDRLNRMGGARVFFLGGSADTLRRIESRMRRDYPAISVVGTHSPPFKAEYSPAETDEMVRAINEARADVLWVGLTAPKQEKWIFENIERLDVRFAGAVGAVFDFYAGTVKRAPAIVRRMGLEWLSRLIQEPRRLWRRLAFSVPVFFFHVVRSRLRGSANHL